ncbi:helix-turn-helix transcriptional regulator [Tamlana sp. I1]|uniref:helix-turn-helix transcriptional regulator n=1 Tax=Tamlana sp. I1 TaxID=2762061 RepID=UPI00293BFB33|nr:helix-turn-helix transcriptional regulator [Tamlana sp. I1]
MQKDNLMYLCALQAKCKEIESMNRIKKILKEQGRTQTWLAEKIGKSYVVVTNYCNNNSQPSIQVLTEISQILDVDVRELLVSTKDD